jgi:hypothetical protein
MRSAVEGSGTGSVEREPAAEPAIGTPLKMRSEKLSRPADERTMFKSIRSMVEIKSLRTRELAPADVSRIFEIPFGALASRVVLRGEILPVAPFVLMRIPVS